MHRWEWDKRQELAEIWVHLLSQEIFYGICEPQFNTQMLSKCFGTLRYNFHLTYNFRIRKRHCVTMDEMNVVSVHFMLQETLHTDANIRTASQFLFLKHFFISLIIPH
jgi:hypothetical protein